MVNPSFDWSTSPLPEAQKRLSDLKASYEKALAIVSARQQKLPPTYHCWTWLNKIDLQSKFAEVIAQCKRQIPDGRWVFRNDGDVGPDGRPAVCCSQKCYLVYWQMMGERKHQAKLAVAAEEGGSVPA